MCFILQVKNSLKRYVECHDAVFKLSNILTQKFFNYSVVA